MLKRDSNAHCEIAHKMNLTGSVCSNRNNKRRLSCFISVSMQV